MKIRNLVSIVVIHAFLGACSHQKIAFDRMPSSGVLEGKKTCPTKLNRLLRGLKYAGGAVVTVGGITYTAKEMYREKDSAESKKLGSDFLKVAIISDSLSKNHFHSFIPSAIFRMHTNYGHDWFMDTDSSSGSIESLFEKLAKNRSVSVKEYGRSGAFLNKKNSIVTEVLNFYSLEEQVERIVSDTLNLPDVIFVEIGHNDLDPKFYPRDSDRTHFQLVMDSFEKHLSTLAVNLEKSEKPRYLFMMGLINPDGYLKSRTDAEAKHEKDNTLYPYVEDAFLFMEPLKPENRGEMLNLVKKINEATQTLASKLDSKFPKTQVQFVDCFAKLNISKAEDLHPVDGWHLAPSTHSKLAVCVYDWLAKNHPDLL